MRKYPSVHVRVPRDVRDRLDQVAADRGVSLGVLVREGLALVLDQEAHEAA